MLPLVTKNCYVPNSLCSCNPYHRATPVQSDKDSYSGLDCETVMQSIDVLGHIKNGRRFTYSMESRSRPDARICIRQLVFPMGRDWCQVYTMSMQSTPCRDLFEEVRQLLLLAGPGNSYGIVLEKGEGVITNGRTMFQETCRDG